jgi:probable HAF family extracellular repeat protein
VKSNWLGERSTYRALSRKCTAPKLIAASALLIACVFASALTLVASAAPTASHTRSYSITDLGTLGGASSSASAINNRGQIVGSSSLSGDVSFHAFLYERGRMIDLLPGSTDSFASDINNRGEVVGTLGDRAFLYRRGTVTLLGLGGSRSNAFGINGRGDVVGWSELAGGPEFIFHAFLYRNGRTIDLTPSLPTEGPDAANSIAQAINDRGVVVGESAPVFAFPPRSSPFLWRKGTLIDLNLALSPSESASPLDINNARDVVGFSFDFALNENTAVLLRRGRLISLGPGVATSINNSGQVVGVIPGDGDGGFLWKNGTRTALNTLSPPGSGWTDLSAEDINDRGQIVGGGIHNGAFHAFLLSPSN